MSTRLTLSSNRVTQQLGIRHAIVQGPFGNGLSSVELVAAVNDAGGMGSFGLAGFAPSAILEIGARIRSLTSGVFALNVWVPHDVANSATLDRNSFERALNALAPFYAEVGIPLPTYEEVQKNVPPSFEEQIEALLQVRPPVASFIYGVPPESLRRELRRLRITTIGTATNVVEAKALDDAGIDIIAASGSDAGGHRSSFLRSVAESPSTGSLVRQLAGHVRAPVIAAGGIVDARGIAAALTLGADGVQIGTAFLATHESAAPEPHTAALVANTERSTMLTKVFTGRAARAIVNRFVREIGAREADVLPYPWQHIVTRPIRAAATQQGNTELMSLWAGQNVPLVTRRSTADLMENLTKESQT